MTNMFLKHHEIKKQLKQIITREYQEKYDFAFVPSSNPENDLRTFKDKLQEQLDQDDKQIKLEKYIYMIPDVRNQRIVIKF